MLQQRRGRTELLLGVVFFIGPLLGAACYVLGPLCSAAAALVHVGSCLDFRLQWRASVAAQPVVGRHLVCRQNLHHRQVVAQVGFAEPAVGQRGLCRGH